MDFEFDPQKSESNKEKHGIDFLEAKALWGDDDLVKVPVASIGEERFLIIGKIAGKHWTAVVTYRSDRVRIISVRRSRKGEVLFYEENKG